MRPTKANIQMIKEGIEMDQTALEALYKEVDECVQEAFRISKRGDDLATLRRIIVKADRLRALIRALGPKLDPTKH
jgi:hypothetical protein